jgi:histidinol-phosphate aminotransferase
MPAGLRREILAVMAEMPFGRYDFALRQQLIESLASYAGVPARQIIPGNGADELIQMCMIALPGPGGRIVITNPTFFVYPHTAGALGREVVDVPLLRPGFELDGPSLLATARPGDLVFICRPNNPTGNVFPEQATRDVLAELDDRGVRVALDEAYYEFCGSTLRDEIATGRRRHLVILRTLSKAFRLAGMRIGYALAASELVAPLERARLAYNLSAASIVAALGVLSRPALARRTAEGIARLRVDLAAGLAALPGVTVHPSEANFLLVELPCPAAPVQQRLAEQGILLRHFPGDRLLASSLRISVGEQAANLRVIQGLEAALRDR